MEITKITLAADGFKGTTIEFLENAQRGEKEYLFPHKVSPKNPIHFSLERLFRDLRIHLLEIYGYVNGQPKPQIDKLMFETRVDTLAWDNDSITLGGRKQTIGDLEVKLPAFKVSEEDCYEHYNSVRAIIENIEREAKDYLQGNQNIEAEELALRWIESGRSKTVTEEQVKALSPAELKKWVNNMIESNFKHDALPKEENPEDWETHDDVPAPKLEINLDGLNEVEVPVNVK